MKLDDLKQSFSEGLFRQINDHLIEADFTRSQLTVNPENSKFIIDTKYYGSFEDIGLHILAVEHSATQDARVGVSLDIFKLMKKYSFQNALVATHTESTDTWRYSLVTTNLAINDKGKITREFSNPRRYSFVLGPNQKVLTPYKQLIQSGGVSNIQDLSKRFSLEVVNNEFYKEIAKLYDELVGTEKNTRSLKHPSSGDESHEFAVRLIGRIIFCWFLREKKSKAGLSLVPNKILSRDASNQSNYYHNVLAPLFFEVLNKQISKRSDRLKSGEYKDIPYLNGGLFSDDSIDHYKFDKALEISVPGLVDVPDSWLHKLFDLLERFNFTVDENTSYDTDLSIDPEMLGRVFENLLARINPETGETVRKSTGSFYTPREIVDYMVDASLAQYLFSKTNISKEKLRALISYDLFDDLENSLDKSEKTSILEALSTLTVLDPACGSGAFPIGMLQKIVFVITKIDPNAEWWLAKQLEGASPELRREFANRGIDYIRKLGIIRQTIFGVDIQPIATEISRLRCFLTLIVDEAIDDSQENRGVKPLPNLDFKFVTANSLITLPNPGSKLDSISENQAGMFEEVSHIDELKQIRNEYFSSTNHERSELQSRFDRLQKKMVLTNVDIFRGSGSKLYDTLSRWDPFEHSSSSWFDPEWMFGNDKFDIILANPPYLGEKGHKELFRKIKENGLEKFYAGRMDLFYFFFHQALNLCRDNGVIAFITTNYYPTASGAKKLRKDFYERSHILELINFNELKIFESALGQHNMITILQKNPEPGSTSITLANKKGHVGTDLIRHLLSKQSEAGEYFTSRKDDLYDTDDYYMRFSGSSDRPEGSKLDAILSKINNNSVALVNLASVNQGVLSGADTLTKKHINLYGDLDEVGSGIFVLDTKKDQDRTIMEVLPESEKELLRPFYKNSNIHRYVCDQEPTKYLIYITKKTDIKLYPQIIDHLKKFRSILSQKRETLNGRLPWYSLHWPRTPSVFENEKIVVPYRAKRNVFAYISKPWYFRTDAYSIIKKAENIDLKYLLGVLNSKLIYVWLYYRGKRKGETLELFYDPLTRIPIKEASSEQQAQVIEIVDKIISSKLKDSGSDTENLEKQIDQLVYKLYDLTPEEIQLIEDYTK